MDNEYRRYVDHKLFIQWASLLHTNNDHFTTGRERLIRSTVNSKFHLIRSFFEIFVRFLVLHVLKYMLNLNKVNSKFHYFEGHLTGI